MSDNEHNLARPDLQPSGEGEVPPPGVAPLEAFREERRRVAVIMRCLRLVETERRRLLELGVQREEQPTRPRRRVRMELSGQAFVRPMRRKRP